VLFTGKAELSIDAKQRLAIPAKTRSMIEQAKAGNALYIIWGANGVLWLWPESTFEILAGELDPTLTPSLEEMDFDGMTFPETQRLDLDSAGRIRVPQELLDEAGLGNRVLLLGVRHHLEIWDPALRTAQHREKASRRPEIAQRLRGVHDRRANDRGTGEQ
jgi:MraZ protein